MDQTVSNMLWLFAIITLTTILIYIKFSKIYSYWKEKGIPYDIPIPPFGMMHDMVFGRKSFIDSIDDVYRAYPKAR